jgi:hypothetical protein
LANATAALHGEVMADDCVHEAEPVGETKCIVAATNAGKTQEPIINNKNSRIVFIKVLFYRFTDT